MIVSRSKWMTFSVVVVVVAVFPHWKDVIADISKLNLIPISSETLKTICYCSSTSESFFCICNVSQFSRNKDES